MTKRRDLMKQLKAFAKEQGLEMTVSEGGNHTKVRIGSVGTAIPRHREIDEALTKEIWKQVRRRKQ